MSAHSLSERLASHLVSLRYEQIPASVRGSALLHILDTIGVMLAGSRLDTGKKAYALATSVSESSPAKFSVTLPGTSTKVSLLDGVFAMASAAHCGELDDIHSGAGTCVGGMVVPAVLALAENHAVKSRSFVEAVVAGYETTVRVGLAVDAPRLLSHGWWPSTVCGVFGVAAAGAKLLGWPEAMLAAGLGVAGLQVGGMLTGGAEGATGRHLSFGRAAQSGLVALLAVERGFTGPRAIFEDKRGFCLTLCNDPRWHYLEERAKYFVAETAFKPFPCARQLHAAVEALLFLLGAHEIRADAIEAIEVGVPSAIRPAVDRPHVKGNREASLASAQYVMAVTALRGTLELAAFDDAVLNDPAAHRLMSKVELRSAPALDAHFPARWPAWVSIKPAGGRSFTKEILSAKGERDNPMSADELMEKFMALAGPVIGSERAERLAEAVFSLERSESPRELLSRLKPA